MFKSQIKLLIVFLLSSFLISFNANAHHKSDDYREISWDGDKDKKEDDEKKARITYCSMNAKAKTFTDKGTDELGEPYEDKTNIIEIKGYHDTKARKITKRLIPNSPKMDFRVSLNFKLIDVLKLYCIQDSSQERPDPAKIKETYLHEFYKEIADENGFINSKGEVDYNQKIGAGELGEDILKKGIKVSRANAVYYVPDYLIETVKGNEKAEGVRKANKDWINKNKPGFIEKIKDKKQNFDEKIKILTHKRKEIGPLLEDYKVELEDAKISLEDTLDLVDTRNKDIKILVKEIKSNKRKYLVDSNLEDFTKRFKDLKDIKFEIKYDSYKILKNLLNRVEKSKNKKEFIGYKKLTGKKIIGFLAEFEDIEDQNLGSKTEEENIESLKKDIIKEINNIQEYIIVPLGKIVNLDDELSDSIPILQYSIFAGIFLIVIAVIVYIYLQSRRISSLRRETDTAGKKFSDIEGKLRDTSERIKTVGRQGRERSTIATTQEPVKEAPKTPEQIIADKFHDMVSDYNEAIDNFSNVAAFKQKWNGVALSRKERQDGTKTVLINSSRAFEKSEIWCVHFSDKYFAFPGSTVKSNMAAYMNLDFEKASRDFKGVFDISSGSSWGTEPSIVRRGGAGFVVERKGKLIFPG